MVGVGVDGSQQLLSLNPTTVIVVLLLGLWLLLGCDNIDLFKLLKIHIMMKIGLSTRLNYYYVTAKLDWL